MRTITNLFLSILLLTLFLNGCAEQPEVTSSPEATDSGELLKSNGERYSVKLSRRLSSFPVNELFGFDVEVLDQKEKPVEGVLKLTVDAEMPGHGHGMNVVPQVSHISANKFKVAGMRLHMIGKWRFFIDISKDGNTERVEASLTL